MISPFTTEGRKTIHHDGWAVEFQGRETLIYFDEAVGKKVGFEFQVAGRGFSFGPFTPRRWDDPHREEAMTGQKWEQIIERVRAYLDWTGRWNPYELTDD